MGKRLRAAKKYNKKQFGEILCVACGLCNDIYPLFCYDRIYKKSPKAFLKEVLGKLIALRELCNKTGFGATSIIVDQFEHVFCKTKGLCKNRSGKGAKPCPYLGECYKAFMEQIGVNEILIQRNSNSNKGSLILPSQAGLPPLFVPVVTRKRKKKKKGRHVYEPYPTFFSSDSEEFSKEIERILYGNIDRQQDKDKELSE
jgi:hypothetical protein